MKHKILKFQLVFILCNIVGSLYSQTAIKFEYPNGLPNSNCFVQIDTTKIGISNKKGIVVIDNRFIGQNIQIKDLNSQLQWNFKLNQDTTLVTQKIQSFEEIEIKPINKKKLSKEILELNKERLPEELNITGTFFFADLYLLKDKGSKQTDTLLEIFKCDIVLKDLFGKPIIKYKNPVKQRIGNFNLFESNETYRSIKEIVQSHKHIESIMTDGLNYKSFEVKKFRKLNSRLLNRKNKKELQFFTTDSSQFILNSIGKEYKQKWDKSDSTLVFLSNFYRQGDVSKNMLSFPFSLLEFSNKNKNYKDAYFSSETEIVVNIRNQNGSIKFQNNLFTYLYIDSSFNTNIEFSNYKNSESFEKLIQQTKVNGIEKSIEPKLFPLRFPQDIFFH